MKSKRYVISKFDQAQRLHEITNEEIAEAEAIERAKKNRDFVQFTRSGMKEFMRLIKTSPAAAQILVALAMFMNRTNEILIDTKDIGQVTGTSRATVSRAISLLQAESWLMIGKAGSSRTYQINSNIFWSAARDMKAHDGVFTASIKSSKSETGTKKSTYRARSISTVKTVQKRSKV